MMLNMLLSLTAIEEFLSIVTNAKIKYGYELSLLELQELRELEITHLFGTDIICNFIIL